jgi:hypothetical protein
VTKLLTVLLIALLGVPGLLPGARGADTHALIGWLAMVAAACGSLARGAGLRYLPHGVAVLGAWGFLLALVSTRGLASPLGAWCIVGALYTLGYIAGGTMARSLWLYCATVVLALAPCAGLWAGVPLPLAWAEFSLQVSPLVAALAAGGVDVLRHPLLYESAATADLPLGWSAWSDGVLAPLSAFVLTFCAAWWLDTRAPSARHEPSMPSPQPAQGRDPTEP